MHIYRHINAQCKYFTYMCIYKHPHAYICMCISGMYFPLLHAFQMCLLSCWLYVTNYIYWDRQRKEMPFCQTHVLENCQSVLPHLSRNIYVTGVMKAWVQSLSSQKCIPVPSPLLQSKQLLFIRFFYIFCDFFHDGRLYNFWAHFEIYIFTKRSHYYICNTANSEDDWKPHFQRLKKLF